MRTAARLCTRPHSRRAPSAASTREHSNSHHACDQAPRSTRAARGRTQRRLRSHPSGRTAYCAAQLCRALRQPHATTLSDFGTRPSRRAERLQERRASWRASVSKRKWPCRHHIWLRKRPCSYWFSRDSQAPAHAPASPVGRHLGLPKLSTRTRRGFGYALGCSTPSTEMSRQVDLQRYSYTSSQTRTRCVAPWT